MKAMDASEFNELTDKAIAAITKNEADNLVRLVSRMIMRAGADEEMKGMNEDELRHLITKIAQDTARHIVDPVGCALKRENHNAIQLVARMIVDSNRSIERKDLKQVMDDGEQDIKSFVAKIAKLAAASVAHPELLEILGGK